MTTLTDHGGEPVDATVPARSRAQRMTALKEANRIRGTRAQWKRDVKAGRKATTPRSMILSPPEWAHTMRVYDLLMAIPKVGRRRTLATLRQTACSPSKTLAGLSDRQRMEVARRLPADARPLRIHRSAA